MIQALNVPLLMDGLKKNYKGPEKHSPSLSSSGLKSKMRFYKSGTVHLGSRKINGHRILNAPKNDIFTCHRVEGILGVDIIKEFNWKIDYEQQILIMYPVNYFPTDVQTMHRLDFNFYKGRPSVFLSRKKNRLKFLLDTGAGGSSNISKRDYNLTDIDKYPQATFYSGNFDVNGILTTSKPTVFQFPESTSNEVKITPLVYYNNQKSSKIGNRLWKGQALFLSLKRDLLYVTSPIIEQSYSGYPCTVTYQNGKMRVLRIEEGSSAWNAGVRQGDEVLKFNGKKYTDFCSLDSALRAIAKTGRSFTLQLTNGKTITIEKNAFLK